MVSICQPVSQKQKSWTLSGSFGMKLIFWEPPWHTSIKYYRWSFCKRPLPVTSLQPTRSEVPGHLFCNRLFLYLNKLEKGQTIIFGPIPKVKLPWLVQLTTISASWFTEFTDTFAKPNEDCNQEQLVTEENDESLVGTPSHDSSAFLFVILSMHSFWMQNCFRLFSNKLLSASENFQWKMILWKFLNECHSVEHANMLRFVSPQKRDVTPNFYKQTVRSIL